MNLNPVPHGHTAINKELLMDVLRRSKWLAWKIATVA